MVDRAEFRIIVEAIVGGECRRAAITLPHVPTGVADPMLGAALRVAGEALCELIGVPCD